MHGSYGLGLALAVAGSAASILARLAPAMSGSLLWSLGTGAGYLLGAAGAAVAQRLNASAVAAVRRTDCFMVLG